MLATGDQGRRLAGLLVWRPARGGTPSLGLRGRALPPEVTRLQTSALPVPGSHMITEFYDGRTVLITGATGFLGQGLVAKMLRDLAGVRRVYVLIRPRRQPGGALLSAAERLAQELLAADVFDRFRREDPAGYAAAGAKVVAVAGDMTSPDLGIASDLRAQLAAEVDLIISVAATVTFDEPLDQSVRLNTLGPLELMRFASCCQRDPVFVQVSTAYVSGRLPGAIAEEVLPPDRDIRQVIRGDRAGGFDPEAEIADCQAFCARIDAEAAAEPLRLRLRREILRESRARRPSERRLAQLVDDRIRRWRERQLVAEGTRRAQSRGWNDVYTFTKAMGEQMLVRHRGRIRLVILRPSVVESSLYDPEPGWIFGLKVTDPLIVAYGRGMVPDFPVAADVAMDLVPVDIVVNGILACATQADRDQVRVFQAATSAENPLLAAQIYAYIRQYFRDNPMRGRDGTVPELPDWTFPSVRQFRWRFLLGLFYPLRIRQWVLDHLPERWAPPARKRRLAALEKRLRRVLYFTELFTAYTTLNCRFQADRLLALHASLPADEQQRFFMDVRRVDWRAYFLRVHLPGLRRHVLKEEVTADGLLDGGEDLGGEEARWQAEQRLRTVGDLLLAAALQRADTVALADPAAGVSWTYSELRLRVDALARDWRQQGLREGDRLLLSGPDSAAWAVAFLAGAALGVVVVPVGEAASDAELAGLVDQTEARGLAVAGTRLAGVLAALPAGAAVLPLPLERGAAALGPPSLAADEPADWPPVAPTAAAVVWLSPSPLGPPRGAVMTHAALVANALALGEVHRLDAGCRVAVSLPLATGLGLVGGLLWPLASGASIHFLGSASAAVAGDPVPEVWVASQACLAPAAAAARQPEAWDGEVAVLKQARLVLAPAQLGDPTAEALRGVGVPVCLAWGVAEAGPVVTVHPAEAMRCGSVGTPLPGFEVRLTAPAGPAEVLLRGPALMSGYLGRADLSAQVLRSGWLHTGVMACLDADGHLCLAAGADLPAGVSAPQVPGDGPEAAAVAARGCLAAALRHGLWGPAGWLFARAFPLRVEGLEHLPQDRPYLLAANHASHLDSVAVLVVTRPWVSRCTVIAAEDYLRRSRVRGWFVRHWLGAEAFDRYGDFRESLAVARSLVGVRSPLLVFPEGTRTLTGALQTFKTGIGLLSRELALPVVPVAIRGTGEALPRGRCWPRRHPIELRFGPPIEPAGTASPAAGGYEDYRALAERIRAAVQALLTSPRRG